MKLPRVDVVEKWGLEMPAEKTPRSRTSTSCSGRGAQTKDAILRALERDYALFGISNDRRAVLYAIESTGGAATPVEISRSLLRELHSVTEMLKRMERTASSSGEGVGQVAHPGQTHRDGPGRLSWSLHDGTDERSSPPSPRPSVAPFEILELRTLVLQDLGIPERQIAALAPHLPDVLRGRDGGHGEALTQPSVTGSTGASRSCRGPQTSAVSARSAEAPSALLDLPRPLVNVALTSYANSDT